MFWASGHQQEAVKHPYPKQVIWITLENEWLRCFLTEARSIQRSEPSARESHRCNKTTTTAPCIFLFNRYLRNYPLLWWGLQARVPVASPLHISENPLCSRYSLSLSRNNHPGFSISFLSYPLLLDFFFWIWGNLWLVKCLNTNPCPLELAMVLWENWF